MASIKLIQHIFLSIQSKFFNLSNLNKKKAFYKIVCFVVRFSLSELLKRAFGILLRSIPMQFSSSHYKPESINHQRVIISISGNVIESYVVDADSVLKYNYCQIHPTAVIKKIVENRLFMCTRKDH